MENPFFDDSTDMVEMQVSKAMANSRFTFAKKWEIHIISSAILSHVWCITMEIQMRNFARNRQLYRHDGPYRFSTAKYIFKCAPCMAITFITHPIIIQLMPTNCNLIYFYRQEAIYRLTGKLNDFNWNEMICVKRFTWNAIITTNRMTTITDDLFLVEV